jgi:hypothetical protein
MPQESDNADLTLALNTTLEREFVSPLTSIRGALEIIRDFPDLTDEDRGRFLANALADCTRLERGIDQLAATVYASAERERRDQEQAQHVDIDSEYRDRIHILKDLQIIEVDFSELEFSSSRIVNEFYNLLDHLIEETGRRWYIVVNYQHCSIWPEAWVAFAHRGKKANASYSLGTVRYFDADASGDEPAPSSDPDLYRSRDEALARIESLRAQAPGHNS